MATKLSIYKLALGHLGESTAISLSDDPPSPNVNRANEQWDQALESALTRAPWLCATESPTLTLDAPPPGGWDNWRYAHRFSCPTGTLKVWNVKLPEGVPWQKAVVVDANGAARTVIWASFNGPLQVDLIMKRPPEALTPLLVDALAKDLASRLAGPIQQSEDKARSWEKKANDAYLLAEASEASEFGGQDPLFGMGGLTAARLSAI